MKKLFSREESQEQAMQFLRSEDGEFINHLRAEQLFRFVSNNVLNFQPSPVTNVLRITQ